MGRARQQPALRARCGAKPCGPGSGRVHRDEKTLRISRGCANRARYWIALSACKDQWAWEMTLSVFGYGSWTSNGCAGIQSGCRLQPTDECRLTNRDEQDAALEMLAPHQPYPARRNFQAKEVGTRPYRVRGLERRMGPGVGARAAWKDPAPSPSSFHRSPMRVVVSEVEGFRSVPALA